MVNVDSKELTLGMARETEWKQKRLGTWLRQPGLCLRGSQQRDPDEKDRGLVFVALWCLKSGPARPCKDRAALYWYREATGVGRAFLTESP